MAQTVKNMPTMQETQVRSLGREDPLEGMVTHSSTLAWRIPWTEEPGRLQSLGSQSRTQLSDFHRSLGKAALWASETVSYFPDLLKTRSFLFKIRVNFCDSVTRCSFQSLAQLRFLAETLGGEQREGRGRQSAG